MPVTLTNKSHALVTLALNTGRWIHLAAGETSRPLKDYEVRNNRHVRRLAERQIVAETSIPSAEAAHKRGRPAKAARSRRKS